MPTTKNRNLIAAQSAKNDEFYTQLPDIEEELKHYKDHFRNKVVYCNCDDPTISSFSRYFSLNFNELGLKKLITTCYKNQNFDLFSQHNQERAIGIEYVGEGHSGTSDLNKDGIVPLLVQATFPPITGNAFLLKGDGDFRSRECIELLKQSDIVVTNPPFSLFREYVAQLVGYGKKFLIIGNKNAINYKEIFKLIEDGKLWVGNTPMSKDMLFDVPQDYAEELVATKKEGSAYKIVDGVVKGRSQSIWFTNLDYPKRHEDLILYKRYLGHEDEYLRYDNYDAIEVSRTKDIPVDYDGIMGVPITFLDKYNPGQFEILGVTDRTNSSGLRTKKYSANDAPNYNDLNRGGVIRRGDKLEKKYGRILIRRK